MVVAELPDRLYPSLASDGARVDYHFLSSNRPGTLVTYD